MGTEFRETPDNIDFLPGLEENAFRYDFFQILRIIECQNKEKPKIGHSRKATDDIVRLSQEVSLAFPSTSISGLKPGDTGKLPRLSVFFFGLLGPNGPLPLHITEFIYERERKGDHTFARFLDMFHSRLLSFFYRSFADTQPAFHYDRPGEDKFAFYLKSFMGLALDSQKDRSVVPDEVRCHFAGLLSSQVRHAEGLQALLTNYFLTPVEIEEFVGHWMDLPKDCGWYLGQSQDSGTLGQTALLGSRIWDSQSKFRVHIGPVEKEVYENFLPGSDTMKRLICLVREYTSDGMEWDINLKPIKEQLPVTRLGVTGNLGRTSWLGKPGDEQQEINLILNPFQNENMN